MAPAISARSIETPLHVYDTRIPDATTDCRGIRRITMKRFILLILSLLSCMLADNSDCHSAMIPDASRCLVTIHSTCAETTAIRLLDGAVISDFINAPILWDGILAPGDTLHTELTCQTGYLTLLIDSIYDVSYYSRPNGARTHISLSLRDTMGMKLPFNVTDDDTRIMRQQTKALGKIRALASGRGDMTTRLDAIDRVMADIVDSMMHTVQDTLSRTFDYAPYRDIHAIKLFNIIGLIRKDTTPDGRRLMQRYLDSTYDLIRIAYGTNERVSNSSGFQLLCQAAFLAHAGLHGQRDVDTTIVSLFKALRLFRDELSNRSCPTTDRITTLCLDYRLGLVSTDFIHDSFVRNRDYQRLRTLSSDTVLLRSIIDRYFRFGKGQSLPSLPIVDIHGNPGYLGTHDSTTVIYFWGSWCGPCLKTIGTMDTDTLFAAIRRHGARMVFVAVERNDHSTEWERLANAFRFDGSAVRTSFPIGSATARALGILGLPMLRVVSHDGMVLSTEYVSPGDLPAFIRHIERFRK